LKKDPKAVNINVLLNEVTSPMPDNAANQPVCSVKDEAPVAGMHKKK
jgi:hypothetical protein